MDEPRAWKPPSSVLDNIDDTAAWTPFPMKPNTADFLGLPLELRQQIYLDYAKLLDVTPVCIYKHAFWPIADPAISIKKHQASPPPLMFANKQICGKFLGEVKRMRHNMSVIYIGADGPPMEVAAERLSLKKGEKLETRYLKVVVDTRKPKSSYKESDESIFLDDTPAKALDTLNRTTIQSKLALDIVNACFKNIVFMDLAFTFTFSSLALPPGHDPSLYEYNQHDIWSDVGYAILDTLEEGSPLYHEFNGSDLTYRRVGCVRYGVYRVRTSLWKDSATSVRGTIPGWYADDFVENEDGDADDDSDDEMDEVGDAEDERQYDFYGLE
jgi:hypothetical protein